MSYKNYLDGFGKSVEIKIETFKENILNSKEFINAFLDLTSECETEEQNSIFESIIQKLEDACKDAIIKEE